MLSGGQSFASSPAGLFLTGDELTFLSRCCSDAILLWLFLSSTHRPLKPESLLLNASGIHTEKQAARPAVCQNSQSSRGRKVSSSCPVSMENPKETNVWVAYSFLKLDRSTLRTQWLDSNSRKVTFNHVTQENFLHVSSHLFFWRSHRLYTSWSIGIMKSHANVNYRLILLIIALFTI